MGIYTHTKTFPNSTLHFKCDISRLINEARREIEAERTRGDEEAINQMATVKAVGICQQEAAHAIYERIRLDLVIAWADEVGLIR